VREPRPKFRAMQIMSILLRYAPPVGAIGASLEVNYVCCDTDIGAYSPIGGQHTPDTTTQSRR
jgi:hypothetical protein